jgi:hypothetical protein
MEKAHRSGPPPAPSARPASYCAWVIMSRQQGWLGKRLFIRIGVIGAGLMLLLLGMGCRSGGTPVASAPATARPTSQPGRTQAPHRGETENAKPGTTAWMLPHNRRAGSTDLAGYTDRVSVRPGESFRLYVSSTDGDFTVRAFRIGWYGGKG